MPHVAPMLPPRLPRTALSFLPMVTMLMAMTSMVGSEAHAAPQALRYLALGDSYTIGEGVAEDARWPRQLAAALRADGIPVADPRVIATTGWTTDELAAAMDAAEPLGEWDFVSLLIGVNNQYRGRPLDDFRLQFDGLLRRAIMLAGGRADRVLVLAIPDWGVTPFASGRDRPTIAAALDAYNAAKADICAAHGVAFVDIAPVSRAQGPTQVADDGLHPSPPLYAQWAALARPVARELLRR
jgi:lysophospholipase L1-like esterase